MNLESTEI